MIAPATTANGTTRRKMRTGDTIPKTLRSMQNAIRVKRDAAQTPIVAVLNVTLAIVAGGKMANVLYLNQTSTLKKYLHVVKDQ